MKGLASIIVPVYNVEPYLRECLDSIINQTYQNLEIIVVNHRSTDNSGLIAAEYAEGDPRIKLIELKEGDMVSYPRNKGLSMAIGEYCFFVDSDDYLEPDTVEVCVGKFEQYPAANIIGYQAQFWRMDGASLKWERDSLWKPATDVETLVGGGACLEAFIKGDLLPAPWQRAYRTSFIEDLRFIESKEVVEDGAFLFELCCKSGASILILPRCLYNYRASRQGAMTQDKTHQMRGSLKGFAMLLGQEKYKGLSSQMKGLSALLLLKYIMEYNQYAHLWGRNRLDLSSEEQERYDVLLLFAGQIKAMRYYLPWSVDGLIARLLTYTNERVFARTQPWVERFLRRLKKKSLLYPHFAVK